MKVKKVSPPAGQRPRFGPQCWHTVCLLRNDIGMTRTHSTARLRDASQKLQIFCYLEHRLAVRCLKNGGLHSGQPFAISRTAQIGWNPWSFWMWNSLFLPPTPKAWCLRANTKAHIECKTLRHTPNVSQWCCLSGYIRLVVLKCPAYSARVEIGADHKSQLQLNFLLQWCGKVFT